MAISFTSDGTGSPKMVELSDGSFGLGFFSLWKVKYSANYSFTALKCEAHGRGFVCDKIMIDDEAPTILYVPFVLVSSAELYPGSKDRVQCGMWLHFRN